MMKTIKLCQEIWRCLVVVAVYLVGGIAILFWTTAVESFEWAFCRNY